MKAELLFDEYLKPLVSSVMWRSVLSLRNHPSVPSPIPGSRPGRDVAQRHPLQERRLPEPGGPDLPRASAQPGSRDAVSKEGQLIFFACLEIRKVDAIDVLGPVLQAAVNASALFCRTQTP